MATDCTAPPSSSTGALPLIIQGGMGVGVSSYRLASAVSRTGNLGVVSGTALDLVLARRLQDGDPTGDVRRALAAFPVDDVAQRALDLYFQEGGRAPGTAYRPTPRMALNLNSRAKELAILGNFVEVWLAKDGHDGLVGINYLEKLQMATPTAVYGAMLAGVDYVLMGAGLPRDIPSLLTDLSKHRPVSLAVTVTGSVPTHTADLDPRALLGHALPTLRRPQFLAIVSAHVLSTYLARDPHTRPDGFVVEGPPAGGHNTPPRGKLTLDDLGEPVFGPRDLADLAKVAEAGLPFWIAGAYGTPAHVTDALAAGAVGIQVGTVFALSEDSGLLPHLREELLDGLRNGTLDVRTDPRASPTGFPFKVAALPGTLSDPAMLTSRTRVCDLGYLRTPFAKDDGAVGYRCPAEPIAVHVRKGGEVADTEGRACLCNSLAANIGLGQTRKDGSVEQPLITLGKDLSGPLSLLALHPQGWSARQAIEWLTGTQYA